MWPWSGAAGDIPVGVLPSAASECGRVPGDCTLCLGQCKTVRAQVRGGVCGCWWGGEEPKAGAGSCPSRDPGGGLPWCVPLTSPSSLLGGSPPLCAHYESLEDEKTHTELLTEGSCVLVGQEWSHSFRETLALPTGTLTGVPQ